VDGGWLQWDEVGRRSEEGRDLQVGVQVNPTELYRSHTVPAEKHLQLQGFKKR